MTLLVLDSFLLHGSYSVIYYMAKALLFIFIFHHMIFRCGPNLRFLAVKKFRIVVTNSNVRVLVTPKWNYVFALA